MVVKFCFEFNEKYLVINAKIHPRYGWFIFSCWYFQASSLETKQQWVKRLRELIQERLMYISPAFNEPLAKTNVFKTTAAKTYVQRASRFDKSSKKYVVNAC